MKLRVVFIALLASSTVYCSSQGAVPLPAQGAPPTIRTQSNLVLVPTMVTNPDGETVFSLTAGDFTLTDNGVPQSIVVDDDSNPSPISMVVAIETGGFGAPEIPNLSGVETMLEEIAGAVPHQVALVAFDSQPHLVEGFTSNLEGIGADISQFQMGDRDAAILDTLQYSVKLLQTRPVTDRRVILLISETFDHGSRAKPEEVYQLLRSTNATLYGVAFPTSKAQAHAMMTSPSPGRAKKAKCLQEHPGAPPGTCMGYGALGRAFVLASRLGQDDNGSEANVPQIAASLTGGKYLPFNAGAGRKDLESKLYTIANDLPNRYILSFRPVSPTPGLHNLRVEVKNRYGLQISSRTSYWIASDNSDQSHP